GALLHGDGARPAWRRGRPVARDEGGGLGGDPRGGWDDHPSPRRRARPPALVRPPAAGGVRGGDRGGQGGRRPPGHPQPRGADRLSLQSGPMSAEGKNFEAILKAKADHNAKCPFPPHTVRMNPFEIERMQWEEGDTIAGLVLEADPKLGTGAFRLVCDAMEPPRLGLEEGDGLRRPAG